MPTRKDQPWRFSNVTLLDLSAFNHARPLSDNDRARILDLSCGLDQVAGRLIFGNDHLLRRDVLSEELQRRGVIFQPLERAIHEHAELFRKHFMSQPAPLGSAKFAALHQASVKSV